MAELTIREIYERHRNGDANSTTDLIRAAKHFEEIEWRAVQAGPVFRLAANEAGSVARAMREFIAARRPNAGVKEARTDLSPVFEAFMTAAQEIIDHNHRELVSDWLTRAWHHKVLPKLGTDGVEGRRQQSESPADPDTPVKGGE